MESEDPYSEGFKIPQEDVVQNEHHFFNDLARVMANGDGTVVSRNRVLKVVSAASLAEHSASSRCQTKPRPVVVIATGTVTGSQWSAALPVPLPELLPPTLTKPLTPALSAPLTPAGVPVAWMKLVSASWAQAVSVAAQAVRAVETVALVSVYWGHALAE
jgi:hypothetical protein